MTTLELKQQANEVRKSIVKSVHAAKSGHPGGSLSAADIMTYLYFEEMNVDPKNPRMESRDRFVLSKGHVAPAYYSALAHRGSKMQHMSINEMIFFIIKYFLND